MVFDENLCISNFYISFFCFFSKGRKNFSAIHKSIIIISSVNLPLLFIYKFHEKENKFNFNHQENVPREYCLGEVLQGKLKSVDWEAHPVRVRSSAPRVLTSAPRIWSAPRVWNGAPRIWNECAGNNSDLTSYRNQ